MVMDSSLKNYNFSPVTMKSIRSIHNNLLKILVQFELKAIFHILANPFFPYTTINFYVPSLSLFFFILHPILFFYLVSQNFKKEKKKLNTNLKKSVAKKTPSLSFANWVKFHIYKYQDLHRQSRVVTLVI